MHRNGNGLETGTSSERIFTNVNDFIGNCVIALNGKGSVKDSILDTVSEHTVNGSVNGAVLFYGDVGELSELVEYALVIKCSYLSGKGDRFDVGGVEEDGIKSALVTALKSNVCRAATLEYNGLKVNAVIECSLVNSENVLRNDDLADVGVKEYSGTKLGYACGNGEGTGLCSGEYFKSNRSHSGADKSAVSGGEDNVVRAFNLVYVNSLKVGVCVERAYTDKLNGVRNVDTNKALAGIECVFKNTAYGLALVGYGNGDVLNLIEVSACCYFVGIVVLKYELKNVADEYRVNVGVLGELCNVYGVTVLVSVSGTKLVVIREPTEEHICAVCIKNRNGKSEVGVISNGQGSSCIDVGNAVAVCLDVKCVGTSIPTTVYNGVSGSGEYCTVIVLGSACSCTVPTGEIITNVGVVTGRKSHCIACCKVFNNFTAIDRKRVVGYLVNSNVDAYPISSTCCSYSNGVVAALGEGNSEGSSICCDRLIVVNFYFVGCSAFNCRPAYSLV